MKGIMKFLAVAVVMIVVAVPVAAVADEAHLYHPNGERCVVARMSRDQYTGSGQTVPIGVRKTLAKCEKFKDKQFKISKEYEFLKAFDQGGF